ncbi:TetR/AcrR family transcriptional regulator [Gordonia humi]|uniref:AcrR family transcriptional regulator n=1 Tax=Gordonia humi TaxID=686429 RepID=A0A840F7W2_9ACTN|nr:TetR/AcrR family transcriptional regulator [Gordonia humi]MBB4136300.1 AcrR family transcriptional regulator [Gordonia humi]
MATAVKDRLIRATTELMRRHGVAGTAVAEILSTSGAARRSIYLNFPNGKSELVTEATRVAGESMAVALADIVASDDPIGLFTQVWVELLESTDFEAGCPIVAAGLGRADSEDAAELAGAVFAEWYALVAGRMVDEGVAPEVAESLAVTVVSAIEGAVIACQAQRTVVPLRQVSARLTDLVAMHVPT